MKKLLFVSIFLNSISVQAAEKGTKDQQTAVELTQINQEYLLHLGSQTLHLKNANATNSSLDGETLHISAKDQATIAAAIHQLMRNTSQPASSKK